MDGQQERAERGGRQESDAAADVVILGGGPGGYACALRAADLGLTVTLVEADKVGGVCLHRGCVPTRTMMHAASLADAAQRRGPKWGIHSLVERIDMEALLTARDHVVSVNHRAVESHLAGAGVHVVRGKGWLSSPRNVTVDGAEIRARRAVVLATGSRPRAAQAVEPDGQRVLTSDQALALRRAPRSAVVLGGGAVGAELTQVWRAFGADVTLVEREATLVPGEDPDVGRELARGLRRRGIMVQVNARTRDVRLRDDGVDVTLDVEGKQVSIAAELLLLAIGRDPNTDLGFAEAGVRLDAGGFVTPRSWASLETSVDGVYALGDLLPPPSQARANVAYAEGRLVAEHIAGRHTVAIDYTQVPRVTHGLTETAAVGLSEAQARARSRDVDIVTLPLGAVARGLMHNEGGMVKVIAARGGTILGAGLVGPDVTELVGEAMLLTSFEATPADIAPLSHAHPTLAEAISEAAMALHGRPLHWRR